MVFANWLAQKQLEPALRLDVLRGTLDHAGDLAPSALDRTSAGSMPIAT